MKNVYEVYMKGSKRSVDIEADTYILHEGYCTFTWMGINTLSLPLSEIGRIQLKDDSIDEERKKEIINKFKQKYDES